MTPQSRVGRLLGVLLLVHLLCGLILPYVLLGPAMPTPGSPGDAAAAHAGSVRVAVFLFVLGAGLVLAIGIAAWRVFRTSDEPLATAFLALAIANLPLQLVESGTVLTILGLAERFAERAADPAMLAVGAAAVMARRWAHYTQLLTVVSWLFLLYLTLWRTRLVPRVLAALGMGTTLLQIAGVPTRAFLGLPLMMELAMPLAPVHAALALWLIVKGFGMERPGTDSVALGTA